MNSYVGNVIADGGNVQFCCLLGLVAVSCYIKFCCVTLQSYKLKDHTQTRCPFTSFCWSPSPATHGTVTGHVRLQ